MSYFIFIYPEKPSVLRRCSVRAVVRWRCGWVFFQCPHNAVVTRLIPSSDSVFAYLYIKSVYAVLPTSSQPRESASGARQTCSAALCVRILVFAQVFVCQTFAPCCRPDAPFPSCGRGFMTMRKSLFRTAGKPLLRHGKGILASPLSLSRIVIPPFPHTSRARMRVGKRLLRRPMSRVSCVGNHFTGFRFSLSRFSVVKIFYCGNA